HAPLPRLARGSRAIRLPAEVRRAGVGRDRARQDLHQGALAGAVLTEQRVDLTLPDRQIRSCEGRYLAEALRHPLHGQQDGEIAQFSHAARSGERSAWILGSAIVSRVATCTPVSMRFSTGLPSSAATSAPTPRSPMANGSWTTSPSISPAAMAWTSFSLA